MYYPLIRALLFKFSPETSHHVALRSLAIANSVGVLSLLHKTHQQPVNIMGIDFPNPVGLAAGLDKNGDLVSVGIKENNASNFNPIKCYPNPSKDVIYFDAPFMQHYELLIYDVFGRLVYQNNEYENLKSISTQFLSSGAYYYKIKLKDNYVSGKFIRE